MLFLCPEEIQKKKQTVVCLDLFDMPDVFHIFLDRTIG